MPIEKQSYEEKHVRFFYHLRGLVCDQFEPAGGPFSEGSSFDLFYIRNKNHSAVLKAFTNSNHVCKLTIIVNYENRIVDPKTEPESFVLILLVSCSDCPVW